MEIFGFILLLAILAVIILPQIQRYKESKLRLQVLNKIHANPHIFKEKPSARIKASVDAAESFIDKPNCYIDMHNWLHIKDVDSELIVTACFGSISLIERTGIDTYNAKELRELSKFIKGDHTGYSKYPETEIIQNYAKSLDDLRNGDVLNMLKRMGITKQISNIPYNFTNPYGEINDDNYPSFINHMLDIAGKLEKGGY